MQLLKQKLLTCFSVAVQCHVLRWIAKELSTLPLVTLIQTRWTLYVQCMHMETMLPATVLRDATVSMTFHFSVFVKHRETQVANSTYALGIFLKYLTIQDLISLCQRK